MKKYATKDLWYMGRILTRCLAFPILRPMTYFLYETDGLLELAREFY